MITVSVLYPRIEGGRFDFDYYVKVHMPMSIRLLGDAIKAVSVERGLASAEPGAPPAYVALCHFTCETQADFEGAFLPSAAELQGDMANYTDIAPVIQFNEIALTK